MIGRGAIAALAGLAAVVAATILLGAALAPGGPPSGAIGGTRPSYAPARLAAVLNAQAITARWWVPGLDSGFDPQGLANVAGALIVSGYQSSEWNASRGPCRVFRLDPESGRETGRFDVPSPCGHAGGLAVAGDVLYLSDTHWLFAVPLTEAFTGSPPRFRRIALGPGLVGALAVSAPGAIWIGTYHENQPGSLYRFTSDVLSRLPEGETLRVADASARLAIPSYAQGAAIDGRGRLWVARSDTRWGELDRLDPSTGAVERRYGVAAGIEGIAFGSGGLLWAVSEAGVRHSYDNFLGAFFVPFFPLIFAIDPGGLQ